MTALLPLSFWVEIQHILFCGQYGGVPEQFTYHGSDKLLLSAKTANVCRATCIVRLNGRFILRPIATNDICNVRFLDLRFSSSEAASSRSNIDGKRLNTNRSLYFFLFHRFRISIAGSVRGIVWFQHVALIEVFRKFLFIQIDMLPLQRDYIRNTGPQA